MDLSRAREALAEAQAALQAAERSAPPITWARLWDLYSQDPPVSAHTFMTYGYLWGCQLEPHFGAKDVGATAAADIAAYRLKRKNEFTKRGGRTVRPGTRNREVMLLRTLATFGHKMGHLARNPLAMLDDAEPEDNVRETVLTEDMLERVRPWLPHIVLVYVVVVLDSGLRRGEARSLRWDQIDFDGGVICMSRKQTKARRSRYTVLSPRAAELVSNLPRLGDHVFHNPKTLRPYTPDHFLKKWRRGCERAGVSGPDGNVTLHDLRRTFATMGRRDGVQESEIMAMGGWRTAEVFTRYNVVSIADVQAAGKKMAAGLRRRARRSPQRSVRKSVDFPALLDINEKARTDR